MFKKLSWAVIRPLVMKAVKAAVGVIDNKIDTPEEREAVAEKILTEKHDEIKAALVKLLEKGHGALESGGF